MAHGKTSVNVNFVCEALGSAWGTVGSKQVAAGLTETQRESQLHSTFHMPVKDVWSTSSVLLI
jgi:hypothetical protein